MSRRSSLGFSGVVEGKPACLGHSDVFGKV